MSRSVMTGWETGDFSEAGSAGSVTLTPSSGVTLTVDSANPYSPVIPGYPSGAGGAYSMKTSISGATGTALGGLTYKYLASSGGNGHDYLKVYIKFNSLTAPSTSVTDYYLWSLYCTVGGNPSLCSSLYFEQDSTAAVVLKQTDTNGTVQLTSSALGLSAGTWYRVELDLYVGATVGTGTSTLYLATQDGPTTSLGSLSSQNFSGGAGKSLKNVGMVNNNGSGQSSPNAFWLDDLESDNAALCGPSLIIARQGVVGTPTFDAWTKTPGGDAAYQVWSDTPFNGSTNCSSADGTGTSEQTMVLASFSKTQSGHGNGAVGNNDTVNGIKAGAVAKHN